MSVTQVLAETELRDYTKFNSLRQAPRSLDVPSSADYSETNQQQSSRNIENDLEQVRDDEVPPEHAVEAIPDGGYGWTVVASCFVLLLWINGYTTTWGVLQTAILESTNLHASIQTVTFIGGLYMACMVACGIVSDRLTRLYGIRYTSMSAIMLFGFGLVATSFTLDNLVGLFFAAGVLLGLATSLLYTATNTLPTQWFSGKLGIATGIVKMGGGVGATVLPLAAQGLIDRLGLAWTFRVFGFLVLATGIPCALLLRERIPTGMGSASRVDWSLLKNFAFLTLALSGAIGVFALFVPPFFLPLFASSIGLQSSTGAGLVAGFGAATAVGRLLGGWSCDRIGAFNTLAITAFVNSLSMLAIWPVSSTLAPLVIFSLVNGCANGSFFVGLPTAVAALVPESKGPAISLMTSFWTPGYLMGAPLAGILIEATRATQASSIEPYRAAIFYSAGVGTLATLLIILSRLKLDRKLIKKI